ncbi:N-6 DNA methylase [Bacteroides sp. KG156]|uniref:N-6 DNA methylase n=2 Tax=Bacteroides TaxID=816 RepID=UPI003D9999A9
MVDLLSNSKERKKALGAFYTPQILSDLLAKLLVPLCENNNDSLISALDPATGDGILLESLERIAKTHKKDINLIGIDIDKRAIKKSKNRFEESDSECVFINTDALYPLGNSIPSKGWDVLIQKYIPNGIDLIVCNPPWGADISHYISLPHDFKTAIGQFDVYDLFIETIISNLRKDGVYGIIVPDSIYCQEHKKVREILLTNTTIKGIVRLGEGFFPNVNFAVSIIYGIKRSNTSYNVLCSHISNSEKKAILSGEADIYTVVKKKSIKVPAKQMISSGFSFIVDVGQEDFPILNKLKKYDTIKTYTSCQRGVELSKKGGVLQCPKCENWFPMPRSKKRVTICPHCKADVVTASANHTSIVTTIKEKDCVSLIAGEDIGRFTVSSNRYIRQGLQGINYKSSDLYQGPKVLVRKTGVGITAGIDYNNSLTNQVVYIVKPKESVHPSVTAEVIVAILCSRLITYIIIKRKGSIGWTSNPYLSQQDVNTLPFPRLDFQKSQTITALNRITELVRSNYKKGKEISVEADAEIERNIASLYNLESKEYKTIFKTIGQVEQMIPFRRLLNINSDFIFQNGI